MTLNPAILLGLPSGRINPGAPADLIVFDADIPFVLDRETLKSKSKNTPFDGHKLQGKVRRTIVAGKTVFKC
jgi:dihydroorotase